MKLNNDDAEKLIYENDEEPESYGNNASEESSEGEYESYTDEADKILEELEHSSYEEEEYTDEGYTGEEYSQTEDNQQEADENDIPKIDYVLPEYTDEELGEKEYEDDYQVEAQKIKRVGVSKQVVHRGRKLCLGLIMTVIIVGASVLLSMVILYLGKEALGIDKSNSTYSIEIPSGATLDDIIIILTDKQEEQNYDKIINVPMLFKVLVKFNDKEASFVAGEHVLRPDMSYGDIIEELSSMKNVKRETVKVMFEEGITLADAAALLEENSVCSAERFIYFFNLGLGNYNFENNLPALTETSLKFYKLEGYLFPDTYEFYVTKTEKIPELTESDYQVIIRKIYSNFDRKFTAEYQQRAVELGMTMDEVITLASIIQLETGDVSQMSKISSVFHNRLNNKTAFPKLESDPTRKYVDVIKRNSKITNDVMNTAYNTYESAGLPPGAIGNPGIEAIKAALYPEATPYYFFCANIETKETFFAETNAQHEENKKIAGLK